MNIENPGRDAHEPSKPSASNDEEPNERQEADTPAKREVRWQRERGIKNSGDQQSHEQTGAEDDRASGDTVV